MGNGFPIAGVLINRNIQSQFGLLGTTFGGNQLACAAALAVLEVIEKEDLIANAQRLGAWLKNILEKHPQVKRLKGKGLMLGVEFDFPVRELRSEMIFEKRMFTGDSANPNLIRILPPLNVTQEELQHFVDALNDLVK
jgi:acetylornithine aminotransferase